MSFGRSQPGILKDKTVVGALRRIVFGVVIAWFFLGVLLPLLLRGQVTPLTPASYQVITSSERLWWLIFGGISGVALVGLGWKRPNWFLGGRVVASGREEWKSLADVVVGVFAVGGVLLGVSAYLNPSYSLSFCQDAHVNVTSVNCRVVETVPVTNAPFLGLVGLAIVYCAGVGVVGFAILNLLVRRLVSSTRRLND